MKLYESLAYRWEHFPVYARLFPIIGVNPTLLLSRLLWWQEAPDAWVSRSREEIEAATGLTRDQQLAAKKVLKGKQWLEEKHDRLKHRTSFRVNLDAVKAFESSAPENPTPGNPTPENPPSGGGKVATPTPEKPVPSNEKDSGKDSLKDSSAAAAGAEHKLFFELWDEAFQAQFARRYVFAGGKDGMALKRLLAASKQSATDLMKIATRAWSRIGKGKQWWNCEKAVSITGFCSRFNEILAELHRPMPGDIKHIAPKRPASGKKRSEDRPIPGDPDPDTGKPLTRAEIETKFPLSDYE